MESSNNLILNSLLKIIIPKSKDEKMPSVDEVQFFDYIAKYDACIISELINHLRNIEKLSQEKYKSKFINIVKMTGVYGFIGGIIYMIGIILYIHAFANTTIGNVLFVVSTIPFITAILSYIFFNEKISFIKIFIISIAFFGCFVSMYRYPS